MRFVAISLWGRYRASATVWYFRKLRFSQGIVLLLPHSGKLSREKTFTRETFVWENFINCWKLLLRIVTNLQIHENFFPRKFPLYGIFWNVGTVIGYFPGRFGLGFFSRKLEKGMLIGQLWTIDPVIGLPCNYVCIGDQFWYVTRN